MNCKDCSSQSCHPQKVQPTIIRWRLDYRKLFRLLALITLAFAWYWGQQINKPNWQLQLQQLYSTAENIAPIENSTHLYSMQMKEVNYIISIATDNSFGGPLTTASLINPKGKVTSVDILNHSDTPAYIQKLKNKNYFRQFKDENIDYLPTRGKNWDAVSGATLSSNAIMRANTTAIHRVAKQLYNLDPTPLESKISITTNHLLLALLIILSIANIWLGSTKLKLAYTLGCVVIVGFMANQLIGVGHFSSIIMGHIPAMSENLGFWILFGGVFSSIIILGRNIYCGHICPFHGIEYLLHKVSNLDLPLHPVILKYGQYLPKVGLWAGLMLGLLTLNPSAGAYEPFSMVFSLQGEGIQWFIMPAVMIGAFFIPNMFCRFFCPAGEMLTLLTTMRNKLVYQIKASFISDKGTSHE